MTTILVSTFFVALFAWLYARQQAKLYWPFRELSDTQFPPGKREDLSASAHAFGLCISLLICLSYAVVSALHQRGIIPFWPLMLRTSVHFLELLFTFSLVFDPAFAIAFGQKWYYLGKTARSDQAWNAIGHEEGKVKFILLSGLIMACLLILKFLL